MKYKIAIIGATGLVGRKVLQILAEKNLTNNNYFLFASKKSKNKKMKIGKNNFYIKELNDEIYYYGFDYAIFCTNEEISKTYIPKLSKTTVCVDFSSFYRKEYPLIVPEINKDKMKGNIICNPNCSTIASVMALYKVFEKFGLDSIVYSTYQAVSGAGKLALMDMKIKRQNKLKKLDYCIKDNLIPYIGNIETNNYCKEENKMIFETKKILGESDINISATCVRVNIPYCHSISINFKTKENCNAKDIEKCLQNAKGVCYVDNNFGYLMPSHVKDKEQVFVGRLRKGEGENEFNIFVVSDNIRKGAAQNGVQILETLIGGKNDN